MKDKWRPSKKILEMLEQMEERLRQRRESWIEEWRSFSPVFEGEEAHFAELVLGHLTAEGVKYAPIYVSDSGQYISLQHIRHYPDGVTPRWKKEGWVLFKRTDEFDFIVGKLDLKKAMESGHVETMDEFRK